MSLCWAHWKESFLYAMSKCIPKAKLPEKRSIPWMTKDIVQTVRKRNYYYRKYKRLQSHYHHYHYNNTMLCQSKQKLFKNLHPNSNKSFWKAVNSLNKKDCVIPTLNSGGYMQQQPTERKLRFSMNTLQDVSTIYMLCCPSAQSLLHVLHL